MIYVFIFIFGAIIGSFLNVVILRHNTGESIIYSGSRCFSCGRRLTWLELIPIFSFLIQKGRCRGCKSKISWQYPIVEAITGLIFALVAYEIFNFQFSIFNEFSIFNLLKVIYYWLIFSILIVISFYDIHHQIIPNRFVYLLIILAFGWWILTERSLFDFLEGIGFFCFFWLLWIVSGGRWMGMGDAKIALAMGWLLGAFNGFVAIFVSFWVGAIFGIFLLLFVPKNFTLKSRIPFGPFLGLGTLVAFLFGNDILQIYLNIFGRILQ